MFAPFSLEFYLNYKVGIEIQGLSTLWVVTHLSHQYRISALYHFLHIFLCYIQYGFMPAQELSGIVCTYTM